MKKLGMIESVPLRKLWKDEAQHFTPWLASSEGMAMLGDALGLELETEDTEVAVGSYRADIVATDSGSSQKVVIENQIEPTDHDHIGKLITYAAVVGAKTIVWVASKIREEHRRAIEWLNDNTVSGLDFYAIEIELWKIGESLPAPRLAVVSRPSDEVKAIKSSAAETKSGAHYLEFWGAFADHLRITGASIRPNKPQPQHWYTVSIGRSGVSINLLARLRSQDLGCELYLQMPEEASNTQLFDELQSDKAAIEETVGAPLHWQELPGKKACRVVIRTVIDPNDHERWQEAFEWYVDQVGRFRMAFTDRVKSFTPSFENYEEDENDV